MFNFLKRNNKTDIQTEWNEKGEQYVKAINEMVEFGDKHGWENWKGKEPEDKREHLAAEVITLLKEANLNNNVETFRARFPPAHAPIIDFLEKQAQSIEQLCFINGQKIVFISGTAYQKRQAYVLDGNKILTLEPEIKAIGKSKEGNVFAIATKNKISTFQGWEGVLIKEFKLNDTAELGITELIPFNNGEKLIIVSADGIYLLDGKDEKLIHPTNEEGEEDWTPNIDMENATLSNNNKYIVVGDQCYDHYVMDENGDKIGSVGPQSSYPHFCLFSKDDEQLITNSCHFYNGITIGVDTAKLDGIKLEAYVESDDYQCIDDEMRIYTGLATSEYYILGGAHGYIKAFDKKGNLIWWHFLGSTLSGITISDDEQTLWVGSSSGMLHKLQIGKGHRDKQTIGNGNHYEEFRLVIWKDEPQIWIW